LAQMNAAFGKGFINGMVPIVLSGNPQLQDQIIGAIGDAFTRTGKDVKAQNMGTFLQVLKRDKPLDRLEPEEKKRVLGDSYKVVDSFMKGDISKLDPQSQN